MASVEGQVAIVGAGVVGCAVAHALAARGVRTLLLEAEPGPARGASGANSGILHTGFDSQPGALETELILRSAKLREGALERLGVPVLRCGARLRAAGGEQERTLRRLAENAARNGVRVESPAAGELLVPGEAVTDPAMLTCALAAAAIAAGGAIRLGARVVGLGRAAGGGVQLELDDGELVRVAAAVNCAGLHGDEVGAMAGDALGEVYPRKGEFLVFEQPAGEPLREILLPLPSPEGKGVLVFPTVDGHVIAGPTARDREDKRDWTVEPDAAELILERARAMLPALGTAEPIAAYAGLRPAGRRGNYVIAPSEALPGLVNVTAIRSTGLSAAFGIGEHVAGLLAAAGAIEPGPVRELTAGAPGGGTPWWRDAAARSRASDRPPAP